jgi:peptide chain release factor 2
MYLRWAEDHAFKTEIMDSTSGEEAGLKSVTVQVDGPYAYGLLVPEKGVHRLVRISPFDSNKRRHTSFASVDVIPRIEEEIKIEIKDEDIRLDIFRSSGAGGQLVNKISSAVRITHFPSGIVVQCQNERSQHQNKASAMAVLRSRLFDLEQKKQEEKLNQIRGERKSVEFGSQIRSYVFMPYTQVKDLRTGLEVGDVPKVMDGGIDPFITSFLRQRARQKRAA